MADSTTDVKDLLAPLYKLKDEGNVAYRRGAMLAKHTAGEQILSEACCKYANALQALEGPLLEAVSKTQDVADLQISLYLNLAMVSVKLEVGFYMDCSWQSLQEHIVIYVCPATCLLCSRGKQLRTVAPKFLRCPPIIQKLCFEKRLLMKLRVTQTKQ